MPVSIHDSIAATIVETENLSDLKVGDGLYVQEPSNRYLHSSRSSIFRTITKVTATQITDSQGDRWLVRSGQKVGEHRGGYSHSFCRPLTRSYCESAMAQWMTRQAQVLLGSTKVNELCARDPEAAEELVKFLNSWLKKERA